MTRALRLVLAWGFGLSAIAVVYWQAQVGNWASRRVAGRCGFRIEGTVRGLLEQRGERRDEPLTGQPDGAARSRHVEPADAVKTVAAEQCVSGLEAGHHSCLDA